MYPDQGFRSLHGMGHVYPLAVSHLVRGNLPFLSQSDYCWLHACPAKCLRRSACVALSFLSQLDWCWFQLNPVKMSISPLNYDLEHHDLCKQRDVILRLHRLRLCYQ